MVTNIRGIQLHNLEPDGRSEEDNENLHGSIRLQAEDLEFMEKTKL